MNYKEGFYKKMSETDEFTEQSRDNSLYIILTHNDETRKNPDRLQTVGVFVFKREQGNIPQGRQ